MSTRIIIIIYLQIDFSQLDIGAPLMRRGRTDEKGTRANPNDVKSSVKDHRVLLRTLILLTPNLLGHQL